MIERARHAIPVSHLVRDHLLHNMRLIRSHNACGQQASGGGIANCHSRDLWKRI